MDIVIPELMQHLPVDHRGYPIPYFARIVDGVADFMRSDPTKKAICRKYKKCWVCGFHLLHKSFWFICGPQGYANNVASDEAMHENCARFSLQYCPHLFYQKAERRTDNNEGLPTQLRSKPDKIYLVKADKLIFVDPVHTKFRPTHAILFTYNDNKLVEA